ncbi:MAG: RNA-binding protein [Clostridia bacterium]|nr:RNA-binding protein [Clostridia bacterium]
MENTQLILAKLTDKINIYKKTNKPTYTNMLDPMEFAKVQGLLKDIPFVAFGGYENAERKVIFIGDNDIDFNEYITLIRIESVKSLSHRGVLGSIIGLGIKREVIGDIIINENKCDVVVMKEISKYIVQNLDKVGRDKIKVEIKDIGEIIQVKDTSKSMTITVASPRIDAIISACFGLSRELSTESIRREKVFLNHLEVGSASKQIKDGDIISVRGQGRIKIESIDGETRKGRIKMCVTKY